MVSLFFYLVSYLGIYLFGSFVSLIHYLLYDVFIFFGSVVEDVRMCVCFIIKMCPCFSLPIRCAEYPFSKYKVKTDVN